MKCFAAFLGLLLVTSLGSLLVTSTCLAGMDDGGVLVVHHDPGLVFSASCDSLIVPADCSQLNAAAAADGSPQLWFVLAAFPDNLQDRFSTVTFGLGEYQDTNLVIGDWGACDIIGSSLEIPSDGWPGPNSGTSISWSPACGGGKLIPVYWFLTYAYAAGTIPLADTFPGQSANFVDCSSFPAEEPISDFGTMGFGVPGQNTCPATLGGGEGPGDDGLSGGEVAPPESLVVLSRLIDPGQGCWTFLTYGRDESGVQGLRLALGGEEFMPAYVERTTSFSRLWSFVFPAQDTVAAATLLVDGEENPLSVARRHRVKKSILAEGRVGLFVEPDSMGYEPGVRTRALTELVGTSDALMQHLKYVGVTSVSKTVYKHGDRPTLRDGPGGPYMPKSRPFTSYTVLVDDQHCEQAIAEMFKTLGCVRAAEVVVKGQTFVVE